MTDTKIAVTRSGGYIEDLSDFFVEANIADKSSSATQKFTGVVDASGLGGTIPYVTVAAAGSPSTYQTPLVLINATTTGGLYAWTGATYWQIAESPFSTT